MEETNDYIDRGIDRRYLFSPKFPSDISETHRADGIPGVVAQPAAKQRTPAYRALDEGNMSFLGRFHRNCIGAVLASER